MLPFLQIWKILGSFESVAKSMEPIDYSQYSLKDLHDVQRNIDAETYPENYQALMAELEARHSLGQEKPDVRAALVFGKCPDLWTIAKDIALRRPPKLRENGLPERLHLVGWEWWKHYSSIWQMLVVFAVQIIFLFAVFLSLDAVQITPTDAIGLAGVWVAIIAWGIYSLRSQWRALEFQQLTSKLGAKQLYYRAVGLARSEGWTISIATPNHLRMHLPAGWFDSYWGDMVTIHINGNDIAFNCIGDPTNAKPSLTSDKRSTKNLRKVCDALEIIV